MAAATYNILIDQGASYLLSLTYEDPDGNNPDLSSGYTASMQFSQAWEGSSVLALTQGSGITLGASGAISVALTEVQTAALPSGELVYHLEVKKTSTSFNDRLL